MNAPVVTKSNQKYEITTLKPSECRLAILGAWRARTSVFLWGPPGIAKSAISRQLATAQGVAFIDIRLSQREPTDLRGIPYPVQEWGINTVRWSCPNELPQNLHLVDVVTTPHATDVELSFATLNPVGANGIHYVPDPHIVVESLTENAVAAIVDQRPDMVRVALFAHDHDGKPTERMVPGVIKVRIDGQARGLIALEEFNSAPPSVEAAAYQLVLDYRLGEWVMPDGCFLIAMGNRDTDRGVTYKMSDPVKNRFLHIEMRHDFNDWLIWALGEKIHIEVIGYLSAFKNQLFEFDPGSAARGFPTPRSWEFVSKVLQANQHELPDAVLHGLICGAIGEGVAHQFLAFRDLAASLPRVEDILSGAVTSMPPDKKREYGVALAYALTTALCYELRERADQYLRKYPADRYQGSPEHARWLKQADTFIGFLMENFQPEIIIMGARLAVQVHTLPFETPHMPNFTMFAERYKNLFCY